MSDRELFEEWALTQEYVDGEEKIKDGAWDGWRAAMRSVRRQEPVAWLWVVNGIRRQAFTVPSIAEEYRQAGGGEIIPLYAAPQMQQEPVAWMYSERGGKPFVSTNPPQSFAPNELSENEVIVTPLYAAPQMQQEPINQSRLWLWKNGDHFWAFEHQYPCVSLGGDPMTLGEPVGYAIFKRSFDRDAQPPVTTSVACGDPPAARLTPDDEALRKELAHDMQDERDYLKAHGPVSERFMRHHYGPSGYAPPNAEAVAKAALQIIKQQQSARLTPEQVEEVILTFCLAREWVEPSLDGDMYCIPASALPDLAAALQVQQEPPASEPRPICAGKAEAARLTPEQVEEVMRFADQYGSWALRCQYEDVQDARAALRAKLEGFEK